MALSNYPGRLLLSELPAPGLVPDYIFDLVYYSTFHEICHEVIAKPRV